MTAALSWQDVEHLADALAELTAPFHPSMICAVARGGLVPAAMLAYRLQVIQVDAVTVDKATGKVASGPSWIDPGARVLVVEDATESGRSLTVAAEWLRGFGCEVATCALLARSGGVMPEHYAAVVDEVPPMPWELTTPWCPVEEEA